MVTKSVEEKLASLKERDGWDIEKLKDELDRTYKVLPGMVYRTASLTGIDPDLLVRLCAETAWNHDIPWHRVLSILNSFHVSKMRIEAEELEKGSKA